MSGTVGYPNTECLSNLTTQCAILHGGAIFMATRQSSKLHDGRQVRILLIPFSNVLCRLLSWNLMQLL